MKTTKFILQLLVIMLAAMFYTNDAAAFSYNAATKTARLTVVRDQIDAGPAAGTLEIGPVGMATVCVTITLNDPSGTISGSVLTLSGFPKTVSASATCTAGEARIKDSTGVIVISGMTVGTSGANINLDSVSVNLGQNVTINSLSFTHN